MHDINICETLVNTKTMDFSYVKIKDLEGFASSHFNLNGYNVVITPWRAKSQVKNPNAEPDDIVLIFTKDDKGQVGGYIGAMPGMLPKGEKVRFAWISCWWVEQGSDPCLSLLLFAELLRVWGNNIMFSDMSFKPVERLKAIFPGLIKQRRGYHIWFRSDLFHKIRFYRRRNTCLIMLLRKINKTGVFLPVDIIINTLLFPFQLIYAACLQRRHLSSTFSLLRDMKENNFICEHTGKDIFLPDNEYVQWLVNNPWLVNRRRGYMDMARKYYFSSFAQENKLFFWKASINQETIGWIIMSVRDGTVKTQYTYLHPEYKEEVLFNYFAFLLRKFSFKDFISFHEEIVRFISRRNLPVLRKKEYMRYYGITNNLVKVTGADFTMQDGSGDYIFT